jgi:hypothetical protein
MLRLSPAIDPATPSFPPSTPHPLPAAGHTAQQLGVAHPHHRRCRTNDCWPFRRRAKERLPHKRPVSRTCFCQAG